MQADQKQKQLEILQFRLDRTNARLSELKRIERRFPWLRLAALVAGLLVIYLAFSFLRIAAGAAGRASAPLNAAGWGIVILAFAGFMIVVVRHRRVIERINRSEAFRQLLETHIARLRLDWERIPPPAPVAAPARHPFASDLDITGGRSLHRLLDTCVSLGGSQRLAAWLLNTAPDPQEIGGRQALVRELLEHSAFRTRLELDGLSSSPNPGERWDAGALLRWLETRLPAGSLVPVLIALGLLAAVNISLLILNALGLLPPLWIGTFVVYFALQSLKFRESSEVFGEAYTLARQLSQLRVVLSDLENYPYDPAGRLGELCAPIWRGAICPSTALRRIGRIVSFASLRNNGFLSLILNTLVPWDLFFAYQLERYKRDLRGLLPTWLDIWYELETLAALANFARLNPENTFPQILPLAARPVLRSLAVGHPLIPDAAGTASRAQAPLNAARVTNDFTLQQLGEVIVITGSNMSGKSTFLRTLGVNLVLAYAGSTVAAAELHVLPFRLFSSMNVTDSLSDGISFFYAEVSRLKALLDQLEVAQPLQASVKLPASAPLPLFFLIDEIFRGTNNRERQLGSRAYTQALAGKNGAGLISTHDLELVHLAETIPAVHNYHFREEIQDGRMVFDFKIRPGASPTTNALRIMALAGLPVPEESPHNSVDF